MTREVPQTLAELQIDGPVPELYHLPLKTDGGELSAHELWQRVDTSPYGLYMDTQPLRFAQRFGYDRQQMIHDLGADVVPRSHQYENGLYIAWLLQAERAHGTLYGLDDQEAATVVFAGAIHDIGESMHPAIEEAVGATLGDIAAGCKTPEDRKLEKRIRQFVYAEVLPDVPQPTIDRVEAIIAHEEDTVAHEVSETAHSLQTYMTATRARIAFERELQVVMDTDDTMAEPADPTALHQLSRLHKTVSLRNYDAIKAQAQEFLFARQVVSIGQTAIKAATKEANERYYAFRTAVTLSY